MSPQRSNRVLICPFHRGKGHLTPAMVLAKKLALLGVPVTVVFFNRYDLSSVQSTAAEGGLDLELILLELPEEAPKFQFPQRTMRETPNRQLPRAMSPPDQSAQRNRFESFLQEMMLDSGSQPAGIVFDWFSTWARAAAQKFEIPFYSLYTSSVWNMATSFFMGNFESWEAIPEQIFMPGLPSIQKEDLYTKRTILDSENPFYSVLKSWEDNLLTAHAILVNSCHRIEAGVISALRKGDIPGAEPLKDKLFVVGPLFPDSYFNPETTSKDLGKAAVIPSKEDSKCHSWLDQQAARSVLFISFGSWARLYDEQIVELAEGLRTANVRFLWVVPNSDDCKVLPPSFLEETKNSGLIITGWAPQHLILAHTSVGGFVTHCGWNSTMEHLTLAGVPIIAWPFFADQPLNSRFLVEELKIGVEVVENADGIVERHEVERVVRLVMEGTEAEAMRERAAKLKKAIQANSSKELDEFATMISPGRAGPHELKSRQVSCSKPSL